MKFCVPKGPNFTPPQFLTLPNKFVTVGDLRRPTAVHNNSHLWHSWVVMCKPTYWLKVAQSNVVTLYVWLHKIKIKQRLCGIELVMFLLLANILWYFWPMKIKILFFYTACYVTQCGFKPPCGYFVQFIKDCLCRCVALWGPLPTVSELLYVVSLAIHSLSQLCIQNSALFLHKQATFKQNRPNQTVQNQMRCHWLNVASNQN